MEPYLLQTLAGFGVGLIAGIIIMLLVNKIKSGTMTPSKVKQEYQDYQEKVEEHFEETSKKFKDMTEQYQDLYKHLSVGATSLCRPDSVAAVLADSSEPTVKLENKADETKEPEQVKEPAETEKSEQPTNESTEKNESDAVEDEPKSSPETKSA